MCKTDAQLVKNQTKDTRVHQLHAEIASCKQNSDAVKVYFGRLEVMWDDLADFDKGFSYCCRNPECEAMMKYEKILVWITET